jgi:hypothetical protein
LGKLRKLETPSVGKWVGAGVATATAGALIVGMILFAQKTNADPRLINWFGITTALAGALAFECVKFAGTVKSRHLYNLSTRITLTPAKLDELTRIVTEVEKNRKMYSSLNSAIELRSRELALEYEQNQLKIRALEAMDALGDLEIRQRRLALDKESAETREFTEEMNTVLANLGESRIRRTFVEFSRSPNPVSLLGTIAAELAKVLHTQIERISVRRRKERVKQLELDEGPLPVTRDDADGPDRCRGRLA